ncbi:MAG: TetR/AcrR family transcriptional regulator [Terriglobales bacterium]
MPTHSGPDDRRDTSRVETVKKIKAIALRMITDGGTDAVSLRAIARAMGVTTATIYDYYSSKEVLLSALVDDVYASLVATLEAARDTEPHDDVAGRILSWADAFREWAIKNPHSFRLIYGDSARRHQQGPSCAAATAERRICADLTDLATAAWSRAEKSQSIEIHNWSDFDPGLADDIKAAHPDTPAAVAAVALRMWGRMHGLVALEVSGNLRAQTAKPAKLYRVEMLDLITSLGLRPGHNPN